MRRGLSESIPRCHCARRSGSARRLSSSRWTFGPIVDASKTVFDIARDYTPIIEPLSLDEAFLEVTGSTRRFGGRSTSPRRFGTNPDRKRPARLLRSRELQDGGQDRFGPAQTARLRGRGARRRGGLPCPVAAAASARARAAAERALSGLGISTLGQLAALPLDTVQRRVGRAAGTSLWERAQGNRHGRGQRSRRSPERLSRGDVRSRRRATRCAARTYRGARQRCWSAPAHRRVDRTHGHLEAPLFGLHDDHAPGNAGIGPRPPTPRFATPRWRCSRPPGRVTRYACSGSA